MKKLLILLAGLVGLVLAGGAREAKASLAENYFQNSSELDENKGMAETYFPLEVGNSWIYRCIDLYLFKTFSIIGTKEVNEQVYYQFDDYPSTGGSIPGYQSPDHLSTEDVLFRYDPQNSDIVLQYWPSQNKEIVRYDFSGNEWGSSGNKLVETGVDIIWEWYWEHPAGREFHNCCKFRFGMYTWSFHEEILAPEIGTIQFSDLRYGFRIIDYTIVPEPATIGLIGIGFAGLLSAPLRKQKK